MSTVMDIKSWSSLETSTWTVSRGVAEMMVRERLRRTATLMLGDWRELYRAR